MKRTDKRVTPLALLACLLLCWVQGTQGAVLFRAAAQGSSPAVATITHVAAGAAASAASGNVTPTLPAGFAAGDLLLCLAESSDLVPTTAPAGWTQLYTSTGTAHSATLFWKVAVAGEPNPLLTHTGLLGSNIIAQCAAYRGVDPNLPFDVVFSPTALKYNALGKNVQTGTLTTSTPNAMVLFAAHASVAAQGNTLNWPAGYTAAFYSQFRGLLARVSVGLSRAIQAAPAALGPLTASLNGAGGESTGVILALRPAGTALTIPVPAATAAGDVMLASVAVTPNTVAVTAPAGWTQVASIPQATATASTLTTWWKVATAAEPASYTWLLTGASAGAAGGIASFSGVNNATPIDAQAGQATPNTLTHTAPGVTATYATDMLVTMHELASAATWTPPAGMTKAVDVASLLAPNAGGIALNMNYLQLTTAGATAPMTATASANADSGATQTVALIPAVILHHMEIHSAASGLTCAANTLTLVACANAACSLPYTDGVAGSLSAAASAGATVNWDGTTGGAPGAGFSIGISGSVTKNVQVYAPALNTPATAAFAFASLAPQPVSPTTVCNFGGTASCVFTANSAGFIYSDTSSPGNPYTLPAQVAGVATPTLYLRTVQAATSNPAVCTPAIVNSTTSVNLGYACNNPATCQPGNLATINAMAIAPGGTAVSLAFDANGSAPITVRYDDVGQITLTASTTVTPFAGATATTLTGSSNAFVVAPDHFSFSAITAAPIKAGSAFSATITSMNALGNPTPSFGLETPAQGVTLAPTLVQPTGGVNGVLAAPSFTLPYSNGASTATTSYSEVGIITLTATSSNYLNSGRSPTGTSPNIGRFIPEHFDTIVIPPIPCPAGMTCPVGGSTPPNGMAYSGQPFTVNVYARNAAGAITQNYDGTANTTPNFAQAVTLTAWDAAGSTTMQNPPAPGPNTLGGNVVPATSFNKGATVAPSTPAAPAYSFGTVPTTPTDIYLRATDPDGVTSLRAAPAVSSEGGIKIASGRIWIDNAYGSQLLPLPIFAKVQYYGANGWVVSASDSSTSLIASNVAASSNFQFGNYQGLASVNVVGSPVTVTFQNGTCAAPNGCFRLTDPAATMGSVDITLNAPPYLPANTARAAFGVYKDSSRFIYLREMY
jgi:hypothetical protein